MYRDIEKFNNVRRNVNLSRYLSHVRVFVDYAHKRLCCRCIYSCISWLLSVFYAQFSHQEIRNPLVRKGFAVCARRSFTRRRSLVRVQQSPPTANPLKGLRSFYFPTAGSIICSNCENCGEIFIFSTQIQLKKLRNMRHRPNVSIRQITHILERRNPLRSLCCW